MSKERIAFIKVSAAMIIVGSAVVSGKLLVESMPVFLAAEMRFFISTLIFLPLLIWKEGIPVFSFRLVRILFLLSLAGVFLYNIFLLYGLKWTTASEAGIISSILPAFIAVLGYIILKEKLSRIKIIAVFLSIGGILCLQLTDSQANQEFQLLQILGNVLIVCSVIAEAIFIIIGKYASSKVSPLAISTSVSFFGTILFFPPAIYQTMTSGYQFHSTTDLALVGYSAIIVTVAAFLLMYQGASVLPAYQTGILTSMVPLSTITLASFILEESLKFHHFVGLLCVCSSIILASRVEKTEARTS
ncbi:Permease of the drug/metabolite transporter (DMT) superfamily [Terribacillus halophilus]|uniref:Permease of the drug/metabolite transporter (DMT) superfamily n=1 Tax=Terribacillus halophilus TaxID=361279 RepID=A0A1G6PPF9_9BACI|nr:DMT family transporter [Terribacillus halophilus]SDC81386.1 Permease of the drug/metabolite transporter (DMT) superfamily [Terribacillus halophilus]